MRLRETEHFFAARARTDERHRRGQSGFGLIEALAALLLCGGAVLAIAAFLVTVLFSADAHKETVLSGIEVTDVAEQVERIPYVSCATTASYSGAIGALALPSGYTADLVSIGYLTSGTGATAAFGGSCPSPDQGLQKLTLEVSTSGERPASETIVFVKRDTRCPVGSNRPVGATC